MLVLLQIGSRILTFLVNQILLRFLSPELLGISAQLELYLITILYFSRESVRVALQRQGDEPPQQPSSKSQRAASDGSESLQLESAAGQGQLVVNLGWTSVLLGPLSAALFGWLYVQSLSTDVLEAIPDLMYSVQLFTVAAFIELLSEPCFLMVQQKSFYRYRAAAEGIASILRCAVSCGAVIYLSRSGRSIGSAPFAYGQMAYAVALLAVYIVNLLPAASYGGFSLLPQTLSSRKAENLVLGLLYRPLLSLASTMYLQSGVKHLLTQGDSLLVASLCSLEDQGIYSLASNYGGLVARVFLQPIEESCRNLFGKLLYSQAQVSNPEPGEDPAVLMQEAKQRRETQIQSAKVLLLDIIHSYAIISVLAVSLGPTMFPLIVKLLIGSRWTSPAAVSVLSSYVYYIPLLAINGVTEAFVASVAGPYDLQQQSVAMITFSAGFAASGWLLLSFLDMGAQGLVWANVISMSLRIWWSIRFIGRWFEQQESSFSFLDAAPKIMTITGGLLGSSAIHAFRRDSNSSIKGVLQTGALAGIVGLFM